MNKFRIVMMVVRSVLLVLAGVLIGMAFSATLSAVVSTSDRSTSPMPSSSALARASVSAFAVASRTSFMPPPASRAALVAACFSAAT